MTTKTTRAAKAAPVAAVPTMEQMMQMMQAMQAQLAAAQAAPKAAATRKAKAVELQFVELGSIETEGGQVKLPPAVKVTIDGKDAWAWRARSGKTCLTWNKPAGR